MIVLGIIYHKYYTSPKYRFTLSSDACYVVSGC